MSNYKTINISEPWFTYIQQGKKVIEGRLNKGTFKSLKKGEIITCCNEKKSFNVKIINIKHYNSFEEYLIMEGLKRTLPNIKTLQDGLDIYYKYYNKADEQKYKVLAIYIKLY
jgi:ASC-1-like (ASCH) protein